MSILRECNDCGAIYHYSRGGCRACRSCDTKEPVDTMANYRVVDRDNITSFYYKNGWYCDCRPVAMHGGHYSPYVVVTYTDGSVGVNRVCYIKTLWAWEGLPYGEDVVKWRFRTKKDGLATKEVMKFFSVFGMIVGIIIMGIGLYI